MPDIQIEAAANAVHNARFSHLLPVWINHLVGYTFYAGDNFTLAYRKTTDGGLTVGAETDIYNDPGAAIQLIHAVNWYDRWTPGGTGYLIHFAVIARQNGAPNTSYTRYYNLDVRTDTITGPVDFGGPSVNVTPNWSSSCISMTKARSGSLYIGGWTTNSSGGRLFVRSTDDGVTWSTNGDLDHVADTWDGDVDKILLVPAGNMADTSAIHSMYLDVSALAFSYKTYSSTGDSWSEQDLSSAVDANSSTYFQMAAAPRHSDGNTIFAAWSNTNNANADLRVWDIEDNNSFAAKANVLTNQNNWGDVCVTIDQTTDDIYICALAGGVWEVTVNAQYYASPDGGATWPVNETINEDAADDYRWVRADLSTWFGRFMPVWFNRDLFDIMTNYGKIDASGNPVSSFILGGHLNAVGDFWVLDSAAAKPTSSAQSAILQEADTRDGYYYDGVAWTLLTRWNGAKGGDVGSAAIIILDSDYDYFDITGAVNIDHILIGNWSPGSKFTLQFDGAPTVNHNTGGPPAGYAAILLQGAANFGATANDTLTLLWDSVTFREVSRVVI